MPKKADRSGSFLAAEGLPIPAKIGHHSFPSDLTALNDLQLRQQMSSWANLLARAEFVTGKWASKELRGKHLRDKFVRQYRHTGTFNAKWKAEDSLAANPRYVVLEDKYQVACERHELAKRVRDGYEHYWKALSRELSARVGQVDREGRDASADLESRFSR